MHAILDWYVIIPDDADATKHFNQSLYYATAGSANFSNADCVILKVRYNELAIIVLLFFHKVVKLSVILMFVAMVRKLYANAPINIDLSLSHTK